MKSPALEPIAKFLKKQGQLQLALIYGSFARGKETPESDLDIAVMGSATLSPKEMTDLISELAQLTNRKIDLVDLRQVHPPLAQEILHDVYWIKWLQESYYEFLRRILYETEDFLPLKDRFQKSRIRRHISDKEE